MGDLQVRHKLPDFLEIIDRSVAASERSGRIHCGSLSGSSMADGSIHISSLSSPSVRPQAMAVASRPPPMQEADGDDICVSLTFQNPASGAVLF